MRFGGVQEEKEVKSDTFSLLGGGSHCIRIGLNGKNWEDEHTRAVSKNPS